MWKAPSGHLWASGGVVVGGGGRRAVLAFGAGLGPPGDAGCGRGARGFLGWPISRSARAMPALQAAATAAGPSRQAAPLPSHRPAPLGLGGHEGGPARACCYRQPWAKAAVELGAHGHIAQGGESTTENRPRTRRLPAPCPRPPVEDPRARWAARRPCPRWGGRVLWLRILPPQQVNVCVANSG